MISFMNFFSCLRIPVDINTWRAAIGLFGNITMGSLIFYLTTCFRCILYSILLLITILFLLFTVHFYDKDLRNVHPLRNALFDKILTPPPTLVTQRNGLPYLLRNKNFYYPSNPPISILLQDLFETFIKKLKQINLFERVL